MISTIFFHVWCWMNHPTDRDNHFQHRGCFRCQVYQFAPRTYPPATKRIMRGCFRFFFWRGSLKFHTKNCHKRDNKWDVQDVWPSDFVCILDILDILEPPMNTWICLRWFFLLFLPRQITHHRLKQIQAITTRFVVSSRLFVAKFYTPEI